MLLREATADDVPALTAALLEAVNWDRPRSTPEQVLATSELAHYVTGWPRPGDFGTLACIDSPDAGAGTEVVGAAWCRLFSAADPGYGFVAEDVPEVSIGVAPDHRGRGTGSALLAALIEQTRARGYRALSLSVEDANRARALYERAGFTVVARNGGSDTLRLDLHRQRIPSDEGQASGDPLALRDFRRR